MDGNVDDFVPLGVEVVVLDFGSSLKKKRDESDREVEKSTSKETRLTIVFPPLMTRT